MALLKKYATEALKYGMTPGMLCFEPRNVPEQLLQKYPMLRGARVDHPFRSMKPRFNLALAHPFTRKHYQELVHNILTEVPEMGFISIVTNDSGAGFEFTRSLYVGANGGAYLIREWNTVDDVAKAAAKNAMSFFKLIRDTATKINPDFRVTLRLETFADERGYILDEVGEQIDVEGSSFLHKGYGSAYQHEMYPDVTLVQNTVWHTQFKPEEKTFIDFMEKRNGHAHAIFATDGVQNFDPLIGIPCPWMILEKLKAMRDVGCSYVVQTGGISPPSLAPWDINREVIGIFQHNPDMEIKQVLHNIATRWVGAENAENLVKTWELLQKSIRAFPPAGLYSTFGVSWYRIWARPLVPNIEAIPESERAYYERFLLSPPHNPNRIDLNRDVLFELGGPELALKLVNWIDQNALPLLKQTLEFLANILYQTKSDIQAQKVFVDLSDRLRGLECWYLTQRNVQAWIAGVHGYLGSSDLAEKEKCQVLLAEMVASEIENMQKLLDLWNTSQTDFMVVSDQGESVHIHGENFGELVQKKIELMQKYGAAEPCVDPNFIWRVPGLDFYTLDEIKPGTSPIVGQL